VRPARHPAPPAAAPTSAPAAAVAASPTTAPAAVAAGDINLYVGGDVNIRDLWQKQLLPAYKKVKPNVNFTLVFDEHALSEQAVFDKLAAAKQANVPSGVDLWSRWPPGPGWRRRSDSEGHRERNRQPRQGAEGQPRPPAPGVPCRASSVILAYSSNEVKDPPNGRPLITWIRAATASSPIAH
jgi:putative spermidine/putrescine transport system substrate-binding protein